MWYKHECGKKNMHFQMSIAESSVTFNSASRKIK